MGSCPLFALPLLVSHGSPSIVAHTKPELPQKGSLGSEFGLETAVLIERKLPPFAFAERQKVTHWTLKTFHKTDVL